MKKIAILYLAMVVIGITLAGCARENTDPSEESSADGGIPVAVDTVRVATLHGYTEAYGIVQLDPGNANDPAADVRITAPATGVIATVNCAENQQVREGSILFRFDTTFADAAVGKARNDFATAEKAFDRQKQMQAINATSDKQYLEAEQQYESARSALTAAEMERGLLDVKAPTSGTVSNIGIRAGETVNTADILAEIMDLSRLIVSANVPAAEIGTVVADQSVSIATGIAQDDIITGSVRYISGRIDPQNGTVEVTVSLPKGTPLRPGQFVHAKIAYTEHADCLAVPSESVVINADGQATIAVVTGNEAVIHTVRPGLSEDGLTEILDSDLTNGMTVVSIGAYGLPDNAVVQVTNR